MSGSARRRTRRGSTVGIELRKCVLYLGLVFYTPVVCSSEQSPQTRGESHSTNARSGGITLGEVQNTTILTDIETDINSYCGLSWMDAYSNCPLACPNGRDTDCSALGSNYSCQSFTLCHENIQSGAVVPSTPGSVDASTIDVNNQQNLPPTADPTNHVIISFPNCPADHSLGSSYSIGSLVAYPIAGGFMEEKDVFSCKADSCNTVLPETDNAVSWKLVGSCSHSVAKSFAEPDQISSAPTVATWWLNSSECIYGDNYPPTFMTNQELWENKIFKSQEDCCTSNPEACNQENKSSSVAPTGSPTGNQETKSSSVAPTGSPTEETYMPTMSPTNSAFIQGQCDLFFITAISTSILFWPFRG